MHPAVLHPLSGEAAPAQRWVELLAQESGPEEDEVGLPGDAELRGGG